MVLRLLVLLAADVCFGQASPWIIVATESDQRAAVEIGQFPGDTSTTFFTRPGKDLVAYRVRAWKQSDQIHFSVAGLKVKPGLVWDRHSMDRLFEVPLGSGQLSPDHPSTTVGSLLFRLEKDKTGCGVTVAEIGNLTTALQLDQIDYERYMCWFVVRNISAKNIIALTLGRKGNDGRILPGPGTYSRTRDPERRVLIAPGATYRQQSGVGRLAGESFNLNRDGQICLASVVFDDGTWDGDAATALQAIAQDHANTAQTVRFAKAVERILDSADVETNGTEQLRAAIKQLPTRDERLEDELIAKYGEKFAEVLRPAVRAQMHGTSTMLTHYIDDFEKWKARNPNGSFREYWSNLLRFL